MSSTIDLTIGSATLEQRGDYLLVIEEGTLASPHEVYRYVTELEQAASRLKLRRILVDARSETGEQSTETRTAMWRWLRTQRAFDQIAYALHDEMTIARVNMTALAERPRLPSRSRSARARPEPTELGGAPGRRPWPRLRASSADGDRIAQLLDSTALARSDHPAAEPDHHDGPPGATEPGDTCDCDSGGADTDTGDTDRGDTDAGDTGCGDTDRSLTRDAEDARGRPREGRRDPP